MNRTVFDFKTPRWNAYGRVVYWSTEAERDDKILAMAGAGAEIIVLAEREATEAEYARHLQHRAWQQQWKEAAKTGSAGRHMRVERESAT